MVLDIGVQAPPMERIPVAGETGARRWLVELTDFPGTYLAIISIHRGLPHTTLGQAALGCLGPGTFALRIKREAIRGGGRSQRLPYLSAGRQGGFKKRRLRKSGEKEEVNTLEKRKVSQVDR
jgi:hypothetical protein